jgi:hypothetical protein
MCNTVLLTHSPAGHRQLIAFGSSAGRAWDDKTETSQVFWFKSSPKKDLFGSAQMESSMLLRLGARVTSKVETTMSICTTHQAELMIKDISSIYGVINVPYRCFDRISRPRSDRELRGDHTGMGNRMPIQLIY